MVNRKELKSVNSVLSQLVLRNLGLYGSSYLGNDIYFLVEAINILISDVGEEWLEKEYTKLGKEWGKTKEILVEINELATKIKVFYDPILDKRFEKKTKDEGQVQAMFKSYFRKTASEMALLQREIYDLFVFLVNNTTLRNATIPNEAWKVLEHRDMRKLDLTKSSIDKK